MLNEYKLSIRSPSTTRNPLKVLPSPLSQIHKLQKPRRSRDLVRRADGAVGRGERVGRQATNGLFVRNLIGNYLSNYVGLLDD